MSVDSFEGINPKTAEPSRNAKETPSPRALEARRQLRYELASGISGVVLALFMWGHMFLVGSILTGTRGFDTLSSGLEDLYTIVAARKGTPAAGSSA